MPTRAAAIHWIIQIFRNGIPCGEATLPNERRIQLNAAYLADRDNFDYDDVKERVSTDSLEYTCRYKRLDYVLGMPIQYPSTWKIPQPAVCILDKLDSISPEYLEIAVLFGQTMDQERIYEIRRVQNAFHLQQFHIQQRIVQQEIGRENVTRRMFHGTGNAMQIINSTEGIDPRHAKEINYYGSGAYFSDAATYSDRYTGRCLRQDGIICKRLMVVEVLIGDTFNFQDLRYPTLTEPPRNILQRRRHDSVTGRVEGHDIVAVYTSGHSRVEYIIDYQEN